MLTPPNDRTTGERRAAASGESPASASRAAGAPAAAVTVENLSKTYPVPLAWLPQRLRRKTPAPVEALRGVSLEIGEGEIFGLIGRNGAGKTTLTKIIATLVQPTSGRVAVRGFDSVRDEQRVRAQVGLASAEERSFYWRLTVEQNLVFFARLYGLTDSASRARLRELLSVFELEPLARRRFGELSTGNKQRVIAARAMLPRPPVLLLDEPTRSLDPLAAAEMRSTIKRLAAGTPPMTVLLTSHNLAEVEELCDRVAVISRGRIRAVGPPQTLSTLPRPTERVRLIVGGLGPSAFESASWFTGLAGAAASGHAAGAEIVFTRAAEDDALDRALGEVRRAGGRVVSCDSERATLLDALEVYERAHDDEEGGREAAR
ncbi:MAG TPA: ABC transporter ATP-binding protein [Pyrinomonadaceae bacterium]